ncbi:TetR family transcriptional regulator [Mycobacterium simiae]|uniref:TetR/AcrR family transcriptional regulator n=1 Tax=Mycobacterium simiae TaxID=1784 RepID=UPI0022AC01F6|nr:TetR family transcriptional regulator [Mycobacterium simiae]
MVAAATEIMREGGIDAISMRSVAGRLGVTPAAGVLPIGNKDALLDAVAEHLLDDLAPRLERAGDGRFRRDASSAQHHIDAGPGRAGR